MKNIKEVLDQVAAIDKESNVDGVTTRFLAFDIPDREGSAREAQLLCNRQGLIYLAKVCLDLASRYPGAHYHLDEMGMADRAPIPLVISNYPAPCDDTNGS